MTNSLTAKTARGIRPRHLWGWLWDIVTDHSGHRRGTDLELEEQIRTDFAFLFAERHARVTLNYYDWRHFGNAYVDVEAASVIFHIVRDRDDIHVYVIAPWVQGEGGKWVGLSAVLSAIQMSDQHSPIPEPPFYGDLKHAGALVEARFEQIVEALSPASLTTTRLKIERINAYRRMQFQQKFPGIGSSSTAASS